MPEPLKNLFSESLVDSLVLELLSVYGAFDGQGFKAQVFDQDWPEKELKDRMAHISITLKRFLPDPYPEALVLLTAIGPRFKGFQYMFFPGFVELYGMDHYAISVKALEHFTEHSSSEFAVRPFIKKHPEMMKQMAKWARHKNHHVRRLASEGCRPRLPWAMALPAFKENPSPVLKILETLKNDESEYVRRSVANNLNDISKDNPEVVAEIARTWLGESEQTDKLVKHACRTLLKKSNPEVLGFFGFAPASHVRLKKFSVDQSVTLGEKLTFSFSLNTIKGALGNLRIEYDVAFMKKNGQPAKKRFKISEGNYSAREKAISRTHSFKTISTRTYYAGRHGLSIIINGQELATLHFELTSEI